MNFVNTKKLQRRVLRFDQKFILNQLLYAQHSTANGEHHAKVNLELHIFASSLKVFQIATT